MAKILITESVHPIGPELLTAAGHTVVYADRDMDVIRREIVDADAVLVRQRHSLRQLFRREVSRERTHAEARPREIHRVCPVGHGHLQFFHIARRGEDLRFSSHRCPLSKRQRGISHAAASFHVSLRTGWS